MKILVKLQQTQGENFPFFLLQNLKQIGVHIWIQQFNLQSLIIFQLKIVQMLKVLTSLARFSGVKYQVVDGQYLIPAPPKRSLSSYLLFANDARKGVTKPGGKENIADTSKIISEEWKTLSAQKKQIYEKKAEQLRAAYELQKAAYDAKYVIPRKTVTATHLIQREFHEKNKFPSLVEGVKAFSQFKATLKQEDLAKYEKAAQEINKANEKIRKHYQIPTSKFKDFNAYLRFARKADPTIPEKSKIEPNLLAKLEKNYHAEQTKAEQSLNSFATSFHMKVADLVKILNKEKSDSEKLDDEGRKIKTLQTEAMKQAKQELRRQREKLNEEKKKAKRQAQRLVQKNIKDIEKKIETQKKVVAKIDQKFTTKIKENERQRLQNKIDKQTQKKLTKKKRATSEMPAGTSQPAATQTPVPETPAATSQSSTTEAKN